MGLSAISVHFRYNTDIYTKGQPLPKEITVGRDSEEYDRSETNTKSQSLFVSIIVVVNCQGSPLVKTEMQKWLIEAFVNAKLFRSKPDVQVSTCELANRKEIF